MWSHRRGRAPSQAMCECLDGRALNTALDFTLVDATVRMVLTKKKFILFLFKNFTFSRRQAIDHWNAAAAEAVWIRGIEKRPLYVIDHFLVEALD